MWNAFLSAFGLLAVLFAFFGLNLLVFSVARKWAERVIEKWAERNGVRLVSCDYLRFSYVWRSQTFRIAVRDPQGGERRGEVRVGGYAALLGEQLNFDWDD